MSRSQVGCPRWAGSAAARCASSKDADLRHLARRSVLDDIADSVERHSKSGPLASRSDGSRHTAETVAGAAAGAAVATGSPASAVGASIDPATLASSRRLPRFDDSPCFRGRRLRRSGQRYRPRQRPPRWSPTKPSTTARPDSPTSRSTRVAPPPPTSRSTETFALGDDAVDATSRPCRRCGRRRRLADRRRKRLDRPPAVDDAVDGGPLTVAAYDEGETGGVEAFGSLKRGSASSVRAAGRLTPAWSTSTNESRSSRTSRSCAGASSMRRSPWSSG